MTVGAVFLLNACASNSPSTATAGDSAAPAATAASLAKQGHKLSEQGQPDEALKVLEQALALDPRSAWASFDRGQIRLAQGNTQGALADLDVAVSQEPNNARFLGARCVARAVAAQAKDSLVDCKNALAQTGKNSKAIALISRGQANLALQKNEAALADFNAVLAESENSMRALYGRGVARERLGDSQGAADKQEALRRLPGAGREFAAAQLH